MFFLWKACFCFFMAFGVSIFCASAQITLTADDLVRAGVTRLSDILELANDWTGISTEGYHWAIAPLGTSWEASPVWSLFIDGHPMHVQGLNQRNLNELPVTITEICEIHLHTTPVLVNGFLAHGGAIQINRCTPSARFSIEGQFSAGNETGDPGPYRYTDYGASNVDRTGPTVYGNFAAASTNWFARIAGAADEHHATDPRIRPRVLQLYQGEKDARILYRALNFDTWLLDHRITMGTSRLEDLRFLPMMGREIPLNQEILIASASFSGPRFGYSLSGNSLELLTRENPESVSVNFSQRQVYARLYANASLPGTLSFEYGVTSILSRIQYGPANLSDYLASFRVYTVLRPDLLFDIQMENMAALSLDTGIPGYEFFSHTWHEQSGLHLQLLIRNRGADSITNFTSWTRRGYRLEDAEIRVPSHELPRRESIISADLNWTTGNRLKLHLSTGWRKYTNSIRPFTEFKLDSTETHLQPATGIGSVGGQIARASLRTDIPITRKLTLKASGVYAYPWSNMHLFRDAWHHRLQMGIRGEYRPNDRFSMDMRLRYTGPATWHEFEDAAKGNPEFYIMQLPGTVHLHLTIQKRFWKNHLRMNATMRNVLDHPHVSHPAGARTRAVFQLAVQYAFRERKINPP